MENLRAKIESDLAESLEGEWGMPVELTSPDGQTQHYNVNNPDKLLTGQVLYFSRQENPETGEPVIVNNPVVTLRLSSLIRVPAAGETWLIKMPISPRENAEKQSFTFTVNKSPEHGTDIGFIKFYPQRLEADDGPLSNLE
jgi:hypothetical protein